MMKSSARNQFSGQVSKVKLGAVNDEIEIVIAGGQTLIATITHDSTENLGLSVGVPVFALIKASAIIIVTHDEDVKFSARNRLTGSVAQVQTGAVNTEVVIDIAGGGQVVAIVTNDSSNKLGLAVGLTASAIFKASSVILAVPA